MTGLVQGGPQGLWDGHFARSRSPEVGVRQVWCGKTSYKVASMLGPLLSHLALALITGAGGPSIKIDAAPAYGTFGNLTGSVKGATAATHEVAVYIGIQGAGWITKPYFSFPTVEIQPNGTFSANVTTGGGLDLRATMYCAALVVKGYTPPPASDSVSMYG